MLWRKVSIKLEYLCTTANLQAHPSLLKWRDNFIFPFRGDRQLSGLVLYSSTTKTTATHGLKNAALRWPSMLWSLNLARGTEMEVAMSLEVEEHPFSFSRSWRSSGMYSAFSCLHHSSESGHWIRTKTTLHLDTDRGSDQDTQAVKGYIQSEEVYNDARSTTDQGQRELTTAGRKFWCSFSLSYQPSSGSSFIDRHRLFSWGSW